MKCLRSLSCLLLAASAAPGWAEPTAVTVRVIARDAKFIGTSMGGARVTLREATMRGDIPGLRKASW